MTKLITAYLSKGDYNVIVMHWYFGMILDYNRVSNYVPKVANSLRLFVNDLIRSRVDPDTITLVGFSLGAQVVGIAGQRTQEEVGRVVGNRITFLSQCSRKNFHTIHFSGIDLARINFEGKSERISKRSSGKIVEIVHTSSNYGSYEALGHIDFYVNGSKRQPSCPMDDIARDIGGCSHLCSY